MAFTADQCRVFVVFATWLTMNIGINTYNKYVLSKGGFAFPVLLTCTNKLIGWLGSILVMLIGPRSRRCGSLKALPPWSTAKSQFARSMVIWHGVLTAVNIGFNNWSLVTISLALNQLIKSKAPLPTAGLSMWMEKKRFSWQVWGSMAVVVIGTALAAGGEIDFAGDAWVGALLCLISVIASAGWTVLSAMLLQLGADKMDAVSLVFYSSPYSIVSLIAIFLAKGELGDLRHWITHPEARKTEAYVGIFIVLGGGLLGFSYDLIHNQFVKLTSSMTMAVMGNTKLVILIVLSMVWLECCRPMDGLFVMNIVGVVIGVVGCVWYSASRLSEQKRAAPLLATKAIPGKAGEATQLLDGESKTCCVIS